MAYTETDFPVCGLLKSVSETGLRNHTASAFGVLARAVSSRIVGIPFSVFVHGTLAIGFGSAAAETPIYYEPGINPYREQASQDGVESVDPYSGMLKVRHLDLFLPGNGGLDIKVLRTYDSAGVYQLGVGGIGLPAMGYGWVSHFGKLAGSYVCQPDFNTPSTRPVLELPDGIQFKFLKAPAGFGHLYVSNEGWVADCANAPDGGGLFVLSPEGVRYDMTVRYSENGIDRFQVKKITDKNGNWLNFDYQATGGKPYPLKITASDGRVVNFEYAPGVTTGTRVSKITANGQVWRYDYTSAGTPLSVSSNATSFELSKVTRPDGTTWTYEYPVFANYYSPLVTLRGYLGKIKRPDGGLTSYQYSYVSTEVLGGARALRITSKSVFDNVNPQSNWAYRYKFWESVGGSSVGVSTTDVTDPAGGLTTYKHETPYASKSATAWRVGLLLDKLECSSVNGTVTTCIPASANRREQNEWGSQLVSPDQHTANTGVEPYYDAQTNRPLLTKKTITQDGTTYTTQYLSHDSYGNPARIVETGNGGTRTLDLTYYNNSTKWIVGQRDRETLDSAWVIDRGFDANGNILSVVKYGVPTTLTYFATGDVASITDANYNRTDFANYYRGVPRQENQPGGVTVYRTVNATGTVATETNGEGNLTQYSYDGLNRLTGVAPPAGNSTTIQWGSNSKTVTRGSFVESTLFDGFGREIDLTKRDSVTSAFTRSAYRYDALGRKIMEAYPTNSTAPIANTSNQMTLPGAQYGYDILGRLVSIKHADGKLRQMQYLAGNQVKTTNERNYATTNSYRSFGDPEERQLMGVVAPVAAANMTITRDSLGQITSMAQAGVTRTMQYDSRGYLTKTYHPETGWITYGRDAVGNALSKSVGVAPGARTVSFVYDSRNRLTDTTYMDSTTPPVGLTYNRVDDIINATRGSIVRAYDYDANRNLQSESLEVDGRTFNLSYLYDGNDALTQVTYPDGQIVNYYPDALGRPTSVSPYVTSITYHPSSQVSGMTYANGVSTVQAFNSRQWPSQLSVSKLTIGLINTSYIYDGLGNLTSMTDSVSAGYNRTLSYDAIDRLVSAAGSWGSGNITYDGRGNLLTQTYGSTYAKTYTYDSANRLASYTGSTAFTYDAWGNATRSGNALSYHLYDNASNLYCASCDSASPLRFEYDASNYRVKKSRNSVVTYSFYAKDGNLMMEYTPSLSDLKQFAYHNKKQVAMRHIVNPALIIGQNSRLNPTRFATDIPRKPVEFEMGLLSDLIPFTPLLSVAMMASAN